MCLWRVGISLAPVDWRFTVETTTGKCQGCGETATLYGGSCYDCCMAATGGNFAEELLAWEQGEGQEQA